jgi:hypothetical protein
MKTVYLSGPVSGRPEKEYSEHFYRAGGEIRRRAAADRPGMIAAFNPVPYRKAKTEPGAPWHECMRYCVSRLAQCDGIALLQGWENSRGARLELDLADKLKIPVVYIEPPVNVEGFSRFPAELNRYFQARYEQRIGQGYKEEFSEECALYETANRYLDPHGFEYLDGQEPEIVKEGNNGTL